MGALSQSHSVGMVASVSSLLGSHTSGRAADAGFGMAPGASDSQDVAVSIAAACAASFALASSSPGAASPSEAVVAGMAVATAAVVADVAVAPPAAPSCGGELSERRRGEIGERSSAAVASSSVASAVGACEALLTLLAFILDCSFEPTDAGEPR